MRKGTRIILYPAGFAMDIDGKTVIYNRMIFYFIENYVERNSQRVNNYKKKKISLSSFLSLPFSEEKCGAASSVSASLRRSARRKDLNPGSP